MNYFSTTISAIGEEVSDLLDGGVLILYADGAPPALAEVSAQHRVDGEVSVAAPPVGARFQLGGLTARITAVGSSSWAKVRDLGHVVISFNGATQAERPGEICVEVCSAETLRPEARPGSRIVIAD
jgi:PTS system glucitol/sorbitol-specific IIA component